MDASKKAPMSRKYKGIYVQLLSEEQLKFNNWQNDFKFKPEQRLERQPQTAVIFTDRSINSMKDYIKNITSESVKASYEWKYQARINQN